jgi:hypothetical protein
VAKGKQEFFTKLFDRAVPGGRRWLDAVDKLPDRIDHLQKKLDGLDGAVDDRVSTVEGRIDKLAKSRPQGRPRAQSTGTPESPAAERGQPPKQRAE